MSPIPFGELKTVGGWKKGEVASALQKAIRRGKADEAVFWASELDLSGNGQYVWKRLRVIASEDVGLGAPPGVMADLDALYRTWQDFKKIDGDDKVCLVHAVLLLAKVKKSRLVVHTLIATYSGDRTKYKIPDYALDMHTGAGRRMGRGIDHFLDEASKLENEAGIPDPHKETVREIIRARGGKDGKGSKQLPADHPALKAQGKIQSLLDEADPEFRAGKRK